ncbi:hypothetical protein NMY22_g17202 [Coprinellus aureogranulatus]|nr:hypothetical protein NMY22_g17202 [Coprinellus aureogranulatus]
MVLFASIYGLSQSALFHSPHTKGGILMPVDGFEWLRFALRLSKPMRVPASPFSHTVTLSNTPTPQYTEPQLTSAICPHGVSRSIASEVVLTTNWFVNGGGSLFMGDGCPSYPTSAVGSTHRSSSLPSGNKSPWPPNLHRNWVAGFSTRAP